MSCSHRGFELKVAKLEATLMEFTDGYLRSSNATPDWSRQHHMTCDMNTIARELLMWIGDVWADDVCAVALERENEPARKQIEAL